MPKAAAAATPLLIARRTTIKDIQSWLVALGADEDEATTITGSLAEAGLTPARMRRWLAPDQAYPILDEWFDDVPVNQPAQFLIEDGKAHKVIAAAQDLADATAEVRLVDCLLDDRLDAVLAGLEDGCRFYLKAAASPQA